MEYKMSVQILRGESIETAQVEDEITVYFINGVWVIPDDDRLSLDVEPLCHPKDEKGFPEEYWYRDVQNRDKFYKVFNASYY